jgi:hypothetical protein
VPFGKAILKAARKRYLDDRWIGVNNNESLGVTLMHGVRKKEQKPKEKQEHIAQDIDDLVMSNNSSLQDSSGSSDFDLNDI